MKDGIEPPATNPFQLSQASSEPMTSYTIPHPPRTDQQCNTVCMESCATRHSCHDTFRSFGHANRIEVSGLQATKFYGLGHTTRSVHPNFGSGGVSKHSRRKYLQARTAILCSEAVECHHISCNFCLRSLGMFPGRDMGQSPY